MSDCRHKFVDSAHCLLCGWIPPQNYNALLAQIVKVREAEEALAPLIRSVDHTGVGGELMGDIRLLLVRLYETTRRVAQGKVNEQKGAKPATKPAAPVSVYVTVRYYGGAYLARTSPPAATGKASSTSDAKSAAIAAARKAVPKGQLTGAFEETGGLWRVEFSVTS